MNGTCAGCRTSRSAYASTSPTAVAEQRDGRVVVPAGEQLRGAGRPVDLPAGEHPRAGLHVVLGVSADAEREQLHQLAGEVLVRRLAGVALPVQPEDQGRVAQHRRGPAAPCRRAPYRRKVCCWPSMSVRRPDLLRRWSPSARARRRSASRPRRRRPSAISHHQVRSASCGRASPGGPVAVARGSRPGPRAASGIGAEVRRRRRLGRGQHSGHRGGQRPRVGRVHLGGGGAEGQARRRRWDTARRSVMAATLGTERKRPVRAAFGPGTAPRPHRRVSRPRG